jgi:hypothetical protein
MKHREGTYIMRRRAERPEVTAATRKKSLALKKPVMSAITARHDPTCYQRASSFDRMYIQKAGHRRR